MVSHFAASALLSSMDAILESNHQTAFSVSAAFDSFNKTPGLGIAQVKKEVVVVASNSK